MIACTRFLLTGIVLSVSILGIAQKPYVLPKVKLPVFRKDSINIRKMGAIGDGYFLNTAIINRAIESIHKRGGGVVVIPAGIFLTGPIVIKSNVNLHVQQGAMLLFTSDFSQYPLIKANWEGWPQMRNQSPISATNATNIAVTGKGIIDGNGDAWRMVKKDKLTESGWKKLLASGGVLSDDKKTWYPSLSSLNGSKQTNPGYFLPERDSAFFTGVKDFLRPNLLVFENCTKVLLEGVTFQNSPAWCLHPLMCEDVTVREVFVKNPWYAQNGDGIDVESCKNVQILNSVFDVGDDALCMKSGRDAEGRKRGRPVENVTISGCTVYASHGGFVIGSEMSGGARNINVSHCQFIGADIGLRFKTARGRGGVVENVFIEHIYMKDIPGEAILFDMYYMARDPIPLAGEQRSLPKVEMKPVDETTPAFKNFYISQVYCTGAEKAVFIRGLPEKHVEQIVLENMIIQSKHGIEIQEASGITFRNIQLLSSINEPAIDIVQSDGIIFDRISFDVKAKNLYRVSGERTYDLRILRSPVNITNEHIRFELGAQEKILQLK